MNTYIIYHEVKPGVACPDGISAAWVASKAYPNGQLIGRCYDDERPLPQIGMGDHVIIVDFSFPEAQLENWKQMQAGVLLIDHHKTAKEQLGGMIPLTDWIHFDMNECGATLAWKVFFPDEPMPVFLEYIRDRDLWNFELDGTHEVHEAMAKVGRTFDLFDELAQMDRLSLLDCLYPIGKVLLKPKRDAIAKATERVQWGTVAGYDGIPFVELKDDGSEDRLTSDICSVLYHQYPDAYFVACFTADKVWSLRSSKNGNNTDVGEIAKANGGGGHRNASGFKPVQGDEAE